MRRLLIEEPVTRAGPLARRLALLSLLVTGLALVLVRDPRAETGPALATLAAGLGVAALAMLAARRPLLDPLLPPDAAIRCGLVPAPAASVALERPLVVKD